jgi:serine/threonine protein kinase/WD40 repeat protein/tetratricopeptide (TPR) repeat protein
MRTDGVDSGSLADSLGPILESFLARLRRGEHPSLGEYAERYPDHAAEILEVFPPLVEMELAGMASDSPPGSVLRISGLTQAAADKTAGLRTADSSAPHLDRLGDYRIIRKIGDGGMGIVYEAEREALRSRVALKVMHPKLRRRADYLRWFLREARAAAGLHHTNIVSVFDYGEHDGVCYYAMQFIDGHSLSDVFEDVKRLKIEAAGSAGRAGSTASARTEAAPTQPTAPIASAPEPGVRSISLGLLKGMFDSQPPDLSSRLAIALGDCLAQTEATLAGATEASAVGTSQECALPLEPEGSGSVQASPATSGLSFVSGSSRSGKSSLSYQREIARLGAQVADALEYAHKRRVIHRDIKPHNILLDALGNAWITDFGLAKLKEEEDLSTSQAIAGTLRYMAPERLQGKSDGPDDLYALGATLYEFLALRPVFDAVDAHQLIGQIEHDPPTPLRQIDRQIQPDLAAIIEKCLAKDPADRFSTAAELRDELRRFMEGRPVKTRPVRFHVQFWRWCKRDPWLAGANISAAVLTTVLAIGSTIAAKIYYDKSEQIAGQAKVLEQSKIELQNKEIEARTRLFESQVERAHAGRFSRRPGQRFESQAALTEAARIGRKLGFEAERFDRLRDEAIACMALPDVEPVGRDITLPPDVLLASFDHSMSRYALRFRDGTISVRRYADDSEITRFQARGDREISLLAFSRNGRYLATTNYPGHTLIVWDVESNRVALSDPRRVSWGHAARFSQDSRSIVVVHDSGDLIMNSLATGESRWQVRGPGSGRDLAFSADGTKVAIAYDQAPACFIVETATGRLVRSFHLPARGDSVAWGPDDTVLATACADKKIYVWNSATGTLKTTLEGHINDGLMASFHPEGTLLASNSWEARLWIWDSALGRPWFSVPGGTFPDCDFRRDGRFVIQRENKLFSYRADPALEYQTFAHALPRGSEYGQTSIRHDGRLLAVGSTRGVAIWDLARRVEVGFLQIGHITSTKFTESGDLITSNFGGVHQWPVVLDLDHGEFGLGPPRQLPLPAAPTHTAGHMDSSGGVVALAGFNTCFVLAQDRSFQVGPLDDARSVAVSPDGQWVATGSHGKNGAQVWRVQTGEKVAHMPIDGLVGVRFSPDGKWLMTVNSPCRLWEVGTWREVRSVVGQGQCFSADGSEFVVVDATKGIRLVETGKGRTLARLESPDLCLVGWITFSPDGSRLAAVTNDAPPCVHVWDLRRIRRRLVKMGLDWDAPPFPENDPASRELPPLPPLKVDYGALAGRLQDLQYRSLSPDAVIVSTGERIKQNPMDAEAYFYRGRAQFNLKRANEAIADLTYSIGLRPEVMAPWLLRGLAYARLLNKFEPAIADLEAALERAPSDAQVRSALADCCNRMAWSLGSSSRDPSRQDVERALALSARTVELAPGQHDFLNTRGLALYRAGRYADAVRVLEQGTALGRGKIDGFDLLFLAMAHQRLGHREQARLPLNQAIATMKRQGQISEREAQELAAFRAEAESVLSQPAGELPDNVFTHPG